MNPRSVLLVATLLMSPLVARAQASPQHFAATPPPGVTMPVGVVPAFSAAVRAGNTLYVSGATDGGSAANPNDTAEAASKRVLDNFKRNVEAGGATMDDLVWVQIFATDLNDYNAFNAIYRIYFKGPLPARAFIGTSQLLGGARFEVMGIAVKPAK